MSTSGSFNLVLSLAFLVPALWSTQAQENGGFSLCTASTFSNKDHLIIEGRSNDAPDDCTCLVTWSTETDITISITDLTCSTESSTPWQLMIYVDHCEFSTFDCSSSWSSEGMESVIPAGFSKSNVAIKLHHTTPVPSEIQYSIQINATTGVSIQCGLPSNVSIIEEQCTTPEPPKEFSMCSETSDSSSQFILKDITDRGCVCSIRPQTDRGFELQLKTLACNISDELPWKLLMYSGGCLDHEISCTENWQPWTITVEPGISEVVLYLKENAQTTQEVNYEIQVSSLTEVQVQCKLDATIIFIRDNCPTTASPTSTIETTGSSTSKSTSELPSTIAEETSDTHTQDTNTPTVSTNTPESQTEKKKMDEKVLIGVIVGGVVFLIIVIIGIVIIVRKQRHAQKHKEGDQSEYSYVRDTPGVKENSPTQDANGFNGSPTGRVSEKQPNGDQNFAYSNPGYSSVTMDKSEVSSPTQSESYPLKDIHSQQTKTAQSPSQNQDNGVPSDYYTKVVDAEFNFIDNDLYSGGLFST